MMEGANDGPQKFWPRYNTADIQAIPFLWSQVFNGHTFNKAFKTM